MKVARRCLIAVTILFGSGLGVPTGARPSDARELSFQDRVAAQQAIERVYRAHRADSKRSLPPPISPALLEAKVNRTLELSLALERHWGRPIDGEALQRETERMLRESRMPGRLAELFAALGNDAVLVQETLVRATFAERLTAALYTFDETLHAAARREARRIHSALVQGHLDPNAGHPLRVERASTRDDASPDALSLPVASVGNVREERHAFVIEVVLDRDDQATRVARYSIPKEPRDAWLREAKRGWGQPSLAVVALEDASLSVAGAGPDPSGCPTGVWRPLTSGLPARALHSAVWTGSEMIVWGGVPGTLATGDRYDPAIDSWTPVSTAGAPAGRLGHAAVWTGQEMIVWGGRSAEPESGAAFIPDGGRYDPEGDRWEPLSMLDAPAGRVGQTATWTGSEMIVWGGYSFDEDGSLDFHDDGARYDPVLDRWTPISAIDAPQARSGHKAVWTGTEIVVWGGTDPASQALRSGGRYAPSSDSWTAVSELNAPLPRSLTTAVWTGDEMIVWGGFVAGDGTATGGRYDPASDSWTATPLQSAPEARYGHSAIWTGSTMVVWGGFPERFQEELDTGGVYDPAADSWVSTSSTNAPGARHSHTAVWTGDEMIVWGGLDSRQALRTGARYDPAGDVWLPTAVSGDEAPTSWTSTYTQEAAWTGSEMIVVTATGEGARYDPATAAWNDIPSIVPSPDPLVIGHRMLWTGSEVIVWSGASDSSGRYDPVAGQWAPMSAVDAPSSNRVPVAVWTGTEMIVWSGTSESPGRGGRYDPLTDRWTPVSTVDAPNGRWVHSAVWTGTEMIVWGGVSGTAPLFGAGGRYDPALDRWLPVSAVGAPAGRYRHTAVWTGSEMIVWGGAYPDDPAGEPVAGTGGRYDPTSDSWAPVTTSGAPVRREWPTAVWTGNEMIVWGGNRYVWPNAIGAGLSGGGHYDPQTDTWRAMATDAAPAGRAWHEALWTGESLLVWGGRTQAGNPLIHLDDGGLYTPSIDADADGVCRTDDCDDGDPDNWISCGSCTDADDDGWFAGCDAYTTLDGPDCADGDPDVHPGAPEINDGVDNQCPGDTGHSAVDEISGATVFVSAERLQWTPQGGASLYEVARASSPGFSTECVVTTTADAHHDSAGAPGEGTAWHFLVRSLQPHPGSWGRRSDGIGRGVPCSAR